jgi:hypothetical protein
VSTDIRDAPEMVQFMEQVAAQPLAVKGGQAISLIA